jgi:hypothetical protein
LLFYGLTPADIFQFYRFKFDDTGRGSFTAGPGTNLDDVEKRFRSRKGIHRCKCYILAQHQEFDGWHGGKSYIYSGELLVLTLRNPGDDSISVAVKSV